MISTNLVSKLGASKYFKTHQLDNLEKIQEELGQWFQSRNNLNIAQTMPLHCLDSLEYTSKEVRKIGNPQRLTYWVIPPKGKLPGHIDGSLDHLGLPMCRLLIPVINCLSTDTIFYKDKDKSELEDFLDDRAGTNYIRPKNPEDLIEDERFVLDQPIWMRIDKLHSVFNHSDQLRVSFTVFYDIPTQVKYTPRRAV